MKKIIFLLFIFPNTVFGRLSNTIELGYTRNYLSNSFNIIYNYSLKNKSNVYLGIKFHKNNLNMIAHDASGRVFYQLGYSSKLTNSIGVNLGYQYSFLSKKQSSYNPFIFNDMEISYLRIKSNRINILANDTLGFEFFTFDRSVSDPFLSFQNNIGIGSTFSLNQKYSLRMQIGIGILIAKFGNNFYYHSIGSDRKYGELQKYGSEFIGLEGMPFVRFSISRKLKRKVNNSPI